MPVNYRLSKVSIENFRGIKDLSLELRDGFTTVLIGANNAGKSTILNAIALALNGGGFHQWVPTENDYFCDANGVRASSFLVKVLFDSDDALGYPAVRGVGAANLVHGIQVKGTTTKDGKFKHTRTLLDEAGKPITIAPRTTLSASDKVKFADHDIGFKQVYARLDDIREYVPGVWLFKPQNIEASLYLWKTGPIAKLSQLLAERFLTDSWEVQLGEGKPARQMPHAMHLAYGFFQDALQQFPFWQQDMRPHLEGVIGKYVGKQTKIELRPDSQVFEEWVSQQLMISLATDPDSAATPLKNMGDGWQSVIRLAALEALTKYPSLTKDRIVLLLEEPETHLHPHLRRKLRKVLASLSEREWVVVYTTHSPELVSFEGQQSITRLVRATGSVAYGTVFTDKIEAGAKLQSKLDDRGAHDFLFSAGVIFCEGTEDAFAVRMGMENLDVDCDARSISITHCSGASGIPAFALMAKNLGIRWCALTDQDLLPDGNINPATSKHRDKIETIRGESDVQVQWPVNLEHCLGIESSKATPEVVLPLLSVPGWATEYPEFHGVVNEMASWIDPSAAN